MSISIAKNVYKIKSDSNVYLYLGEEPAIIDTSAGEFKEYIRKEIEKLVPLGKIKHVILTHLHYDHCENVDLFPNAILYADKQEIEDFLKKPENFFFDHVPEKIYGLIKRARPMPAILGPLKLISVPGHTRGSISLMDEENKLLFSGDTLFKTGIGRTDFENSVPEKMNKSLTKLLRLLKEKNLRLMSGHDY